ncbi:hypothetical protein QJS66_03415 [Kocuria rhizophila]|nr:hypothetical protein QJS66_03415 [Kocuria rhizophila]
MNLIDDADPDIGGGGGRGTTCTAWTSRTWRADPVRGQGHAAAVRQPMETVKSFGAIETSRTIPAKIARFVDRSRTTAPPAGRSTRSWPRLGNYAFDRHALVEALRTDNEKVDTHHDMAGHYAVLLAAEAVLYDFTHNDYRLHGAGPAVLADVDLGLTTSPSMPHPRRRCSTLTTTGRSTRNQTMASARTVRDPNGQAGVALTPPLPPLLPWRADHRRPTWSSALPQVKARRPPRPPSPVEPQNVQIGAGATVHRSAPGQEVAVLPGSPGLDRSRTSRAGSRSRSRGLTIAPRITASKRRRTGRRCSRCYGDTAPAPTPGTGSQPDQRRAATRAEQIRVEDYRVTVDLGRRPESTTFGSEVTVRFTAEEGAETFIDSTTTRSRRRSSTVSSWTWTTWWTVTDLAARAGPGERAARGRLRATPARAANRTVIDQDVRSSTRVRTLRISRRASRCLSSRTSKAARLHLTPGWICRVQREAGGSTPTGGRDVPARSPVRAHAADLLRHHHHPGGTVRHGHGLSGAATDPHGEPVNPLRGAARPVAPPSTWTPRRHAHQAGPWTSSRSRPGFASRGQDEQAFVPE